ncbi:MAG: hypothetical protein AAF959_29415, partial [Cyanobacteria bacterium P01_D01_bin.56]
MRAIENPQQVYGEVADNPVLLEKSLVEPTLEGLGIAYASFSQDWIICNFTIDLLGILNSTHKAFLKLAA